MSYPQPATRIAGEREAGVTCPHCRGQVLLGDAVAVCPACGTIHHEPCWATAGSCGAYVCAPARRDFANGLEPALRISVIDLQRAQPTVPSAPRSVPAPSKAARSGLAVAGLICGIVALTPLGVIVGLVAIILGSLGLGFARAHRLRGTGMALSGVFLGLVGMVGWVVVLAVMFLKPGHLIKISDSPPEEVSLEGGDPKIERALRANVLIESRAGWGGLGKAIGSGVILRLDHREALILTNRHVVDASFPDDPPAQADGKPGQPLDVKMIDGVAQSGEVTWMAPGGLDLALVRVAAPSPKARAALWQMGRHPHVGDQVFAIGNPHGLGWTHTQGTISQFRRQSVGGRQVHLIQTQTAINPGNSGGGLYDRDGYLIGIASMTQDKRISEGLNFAIALDDLAGVAPADLDLQAGSGEQGRK